LCGFICCTDIVMAQLWSDHCIAVCPINSNSPTGSTSPSQCTCVNGFTGPAGLRESCATVCESVSFVPSGGPCTAATCPPGESTLCDDCECALLGYTGQDGGTCLACLASTFKSLPGSSACQNCPSNSNSPLASISQQNCTCKAGFAGTAGGMCSACSSGSYSAVQGASTCLGRRCVSFIQKYSWFCDSSLSSWLLGRQLRAHFVVLLRPLLGGALWLERWSNEPQLYWCLQARPC